MENSKIPPLYNEKEYCYVSGECLKKITGGDVNNLSNNKEKSHIDFGIEITHINGDKEWRKNGLLHRINEPAIIKSDGSKEWYLNGIRHRIKGPAIEYSNGDKEWWIKGKKQKELKSGKYIEYNNKVWYLDEESDLLINVSLFRKTQDFQKSQEPPPYSVINEKH
jgi:hypothetical protein